MKKISSLFSQKFINKPELLVIIVFLNFSILSLTKIILTTYFTCNLNNQIFEFIAILLILILYLTYLHFHTVIQKKISKYPFDDLFHALLIFIIIIILTEFDSFCYADDKLMQGFKTFYVIWAFFHKITQIQLKYIVFLCIYIYTNFRLNDKIFAILNLFFLFIFIIFWGFYLYIATKPNIFIKSRVSKEKSFTFKNKEVKNSEDEQIFPFNSKILRLVLQKTSDFILIFDQNMNNLYQNQLHREKFQFNSDKNKLLSFKTKILKIESSFNCSSAKSEKKGKKENKINFNDHHNKIVNLELFLKEIIQKEVKHGSLKATQLLFFMKTESLNNSKIRFLIYIYQTEKAINILVLVKFQGKLKHSQSENSDQNIAALVEQQKKVLSYVSHEFRTPLNCINGILQSLEDLIPIKVYEHYIKPAFNSGKYLMNMIQDILDISQIKAGKFKLQIIEFDLNLLLKDIFSLFELQANMKKIDISFEISPKIPIIIQTDPNRLKQVIINLLSNAFKYTQKGSIRLVCEPYFELKEKKFEQFGNSDFLVEIIKISVHDTGLGIKDEDKSKLLKAFGKVEDEINLKFNSQGVGLGLIISQDISQILAENLKIEDKVKGLQFTSEYGKGSTFYFVFENKKCDYSPQEMQFSKNEIEIISEKEIDSPEFNNKQLKNLQYKKKFKECLDNQHILATPTLGKHNYLENHKNVICALTFPPKEIFESNKKGLLPLSVSESVICTRISQKNIKNASPVRDVDIKKINHVNNPILKSASFLSDMSISFMSNSKSQSNCSKLTEFKNKIDVCNFPKRCSCAEILICDDDSYNILALQILLESFNFCIETSNSGDEAIHKLKEFHDNKNKCCNLFKIIFLDIEMPYKDGFTTCEEMKDFLKGIGQETNTKIVACTGYNDSESIAKIHLAGFDGHLAKPILKGALASFLIENYNEKKN